ncbi:MAG: hypothetical protein FJ315_08820, partial [SAR202 cluster bacterium]|nr:hypothetical protein [SAR202 cluster bacterium]
MAPASNITDHDQLFKRLFEAFLPQYVELFYPEFAGRMDFSRIVFHQQDLYTDHPVGDRYVLDVVAEVGPDGGEGKVVVLHVAIEYDRRTGIAAEMYEAYKWLQARFRDPILPLVVYLTTGAGGRREEVHQECVF